MMLNFWLISVFTVKQSTATLLTGSKLQPLQPITDTTSHDLKMWAVASKCPFRPLTDFSSYRIGSFHHICIVGHNYNYFA